LQLVTSSATSAKAIDQWRPRLKTRVRAKEHHW